MPLFPNLIRRRRRRYVEARADIQDGDVLLFSGDGLWSEVIKLGTHTKYSHAGMAGYWDEDLMCLDMVEFHGSRADLLSAYVEGYRGTVDLFRATQFTAAQRLAARKAMVRITGQDYGRKSLFYKALRVIPYIGRWFPAPTNDDGQPCDVFCSAAVVRAFRYAGCPLTAKADVDVAPGDLAQLVEYQFSLSGGAA